MKHVDVTPLHKKRNKSLKGNYRSVFILPVSLKVFKRSVFKQMSSFLDELLIKISMRLQKRI